MSKTAWLIVTAPDGPDQWDISKWTYFRDHFLHFPSVKSGETVSAWVQDNRKVTAYATREEADAAAFDMTVKDPTLMSRIHVWRFEQPVEDFVGIRPWRRAGE